MPRKPPVAVVGEFFVDHIFGDFDSLPRLGEESFARRYKRELGGGAAITACGLAKLGVNVFVVGAVGEEDREWVLQRLTSFGVNCSNLHCEPGEPTGVTVSVSTREDRAFFSYYGANIRLRSILQAESTATILSAARHVHFACSLDASKEGALLAAVHRKTQTSIDVQAHMSWLTRPENLQILRQCDLFFPNEVEGGWVSGGGDPSEILYKLKDKGIRKVALKLGGKGAALLWGGRQMLIDPFPAQTVDTTGAGDCFDAGFIFAWLQGYPARRCLQIANICGALSTRAFGGIDGFPSIEEVDACERQWQARR